MGLMLAQAERLKDAIDSDIAEQGWYENCRCVLKLGNIKKTVTSLTAYVVFEEKVDEVTAKDAKKWLLERFKENSKAYYNEADFRGFEVKAINERAARINSVDSELQLRVSHFPEAHATTPANESSAQHSL